MRGGVLVCTLEINIIFRITIGVCGVKTQVCSLDSCLSPLSLVIKKAGQECERYRKTDNSIDSFCLGESLSVKRVT